MRCKKRFCFGPSNSLSKSFKFFKLLGQCLGRKTQRNQTTGSLNAVSQLTLPTNKIKSRKVALKNLANGVTMAAVIVESK